MVAALRGEEQMTLFLLFSLKTSSMITTTNTKFTNKAAFRVQTTESFFCFLPTDIWK